MIKARQVPNNVLQIKDMHGYSHSDPGAIENVLQIKPGKHVQPLHVPTVRTEWEFLLQMLVALNFPKHFIDLVMMCVSSTSYSLSLNGNSFGFFKGLCLNRDKSEIFFNGMASGVTDGIIQVSGFKKGLLPFRYLGVPISSKKLTKNEGMKLIDKITTRIRSWGARHLSYSGRLVLVNSVLTGLHSYWSSIFLIPNGILNKIDVVCRNYLWGGNENYLKAPNSNWDTCYTPKEEGGLGIKASKLWNKALLGKYVWWVASKKDHL
ncbi:uncharacterized protein LOC141601846 [Silene latifolia]|uniref:uncharacterized protein LOC141601846 n=1 Tax=Silene latifolia TaxID=37657 RepID=UPI003D7857D9